MLIIVFHVYRILGGLECREMEASTTASGTQLSVASPPNDTDEYTPEHLRLAGRFPLKTITILSIGPILSQITTACYGVVDTMWVSRAIGEKGMTAVSAYNCFDDIGRSFGQLLQSAGATQVSFLYGKGKKDEASQVVADIFRLSFIIGICVPLLLNWGLQPAVKWMGASDEIIKMGYKYMLPILFCTPTSILFLAVGGCVQGEGRTLLFGVSSIVVLLINGLVLDPIFLLWWKWDLVGASLATTVAEIIGAFTLVAMFFCGKFGVKPHFRQLLGPFSPHTWPALRVGISQGMAFLAQIIPSILVRKFIGSACSSDDEYNHAMAGYNASLRYNPLTQSIIIGICQGLVPAASFAFAAKMYKRWMVLLGHACWINFAWGSFMALICIFLPRELAKIFSTEKNYLDMAEKMIRAWNSFGFVAFGRMNMQACLQSMQKGTWATVFSFTTQFLPTIGFACLLFYTDKHSPCRMNWAYSFTFGFGFIAACFVVIKPLWDIRKKIKSGDCDNSIVIGQSCNPDEYEKLA